MGWDELMELEERKRAVLGQKDPKGGPPLSRMDFSTTHFRASSSSPIITLRCRQGRAAKKWVG